MGPAPSLSTYEAQADATYAPQEQAEQTTDTATHQENLNTLNTQLNSVNPQYDEQEQQLTQTVQGEVAQINQTYSQHLLGNFSGLQGNDMGELFSKANLQEQEIETQRTNAVNAINTSIANENLGYNAEIAALTPKYQGLEEDAADTGYNAAVTAYQTQQYQQEELGLKEATLENTENYENEELGLKSEEDANSVLSGYTAKEKSGGVGYSYTGPNGQPIDLGQYASVLGGGDPDKTLSIVENTLSQSQTKYDKQALGQIKAESNAGASSSDILKGLAEIFGLDFSGTPGT